MTDTAPTPEDVAATALDEADTAPPESPPLDGHTHDGEPRTATAADLQPGMYVQPGEMGFVLNMQAMPDGRVWVVARIEHAAGSTVLPLPVDFARSFGLGLLDEAARGATAQQQIAADLAAQQAQAQQGGEGPRLLGPDGQPAAPSGE